MVLQRFFKDIEDGHYDKYMDLSVSTFDLQNPAMMRRALGLPDNDQGGRHVSGTGGFRRGSSFGGFLKTGDVLLSI